VVAGQEYGAWPYELTGISVSSDGQSSRPSLTVANISGTIGALCRRFQGMAKAKVIIHDTFAHYLDARNFPDGNPTANPNEERKQVYYIDRKSGSDDETVEFELSSPADLRATHSDPANSANVHVVHAGLVQNRERLHLRRAKRLVR
jgi:lambda family phage minor tail protein L